MLRLRMDVGFLLGQLAAVHQRLHVGMVHGALDQLAAVEMVDARVAGMDPVAVARRVDEEGGQRAVRLLLGWTAR